MKIKDGYVLREVAGYSVVVPVGEAAQNFNGMINLNESGAMLWRALENGATEEGLTELLLSEYDIDRAAAAADVNEFIGKMKSADLLEL